MLSDLRPEELISKLPLEPGMQVVDFGCGTGFLALPIAKNILPNGRVLAIDIVPEYLEALKLKAINQNLNYSIVTKCVDLITPEATGLKDSSVEGVVMANVLFQNNSQNKATILKEAKRILRSEGFLLIVDWRSGDLPINDNFYPLDKEALLELLGKSGFILNKELSLKTTAHIALLFSKA
jgi:ubiquinone/menaquinone biosynthesis C-methylase UbiE